MRMAAFMEGLSYKDAFYTGEQLTAAKNEGKRRWSGVPELILHDKDGNDVQTMGQSNTCLKVIGTLGGTMYPDNLLQSALVDETMNAIEDFFALLVPYFVEQDADKKKEMAAKVMGENGDGKVPYYYSKFEQRLVENEARGFKNGFFVGDTMTVCDLKVFTALVFNDGLADFDLAAMFKTLPKMAAFYAMMKDHEKIKAFNAAFKAQTEKTAANPADNVHFVKGKNAYIAM